MRRLGIGPSEILALLRRELADELDGDGDGATLSGARS
jgi:hypothetical protein